MRHAKRFFGILACLGSMLATSGGGMAQEGAADSPICIENWEQVGSFNRTADVHVERYNRLLGEYGTEQGQWDSLKAQYTAARTNFEMAQAEALARRLDQQRLRMAEISEGIQSNLSGIIGGRQGACDMVRARAGCSSGPTDYGACVANFDLAGLRQQESAMRDHTAALKKTWRTAEDNDFSIPEACPDEEAAKLLYADVTEAFGRVFYVRGVRTFPISPGTRVQSGDVVAAEEGSEITLNFTGHLMKVYEKSKFEIPSIESIRSDPPPTGSSLSLSGLWTHLKDLIQGESFEIKIPTAVCGVRG